MAFQSLFWWNVLLNHRRCIIWSEVNMAFQSLFWWNVLLNARSWRGSPALGSVSILVLVECTSESPTLTRRRMWTICFNPCSGGMYF